MAVSELVPNQQAVTSEALTWPQKAKALVVKTAEAYTQAGELLKGIKALRAKVAETFDSHIQRAFQAHRALTAEKQKAEAPLAEAERVVKAAMVAFDQEQLRIARERQHQADEAARRREEDERLARAAAMETEAREFGDAGLKAAADLLLEQPAPVVVAPLVEVETPKVAGISMRDNWKFRVVDEAAIPREYLMRDDTKIGRVVKAMKDGTNIPGIVAYNDPVVASRAS